LYKFAGADVDFIPPPGAERRDERGTFGGAARLGDDADGWVSLVTGSPRPREVTELEQTAQDYLV